MSKPYSSLPVVPATGITRRGLLISTLSVAALSALGIQRTPATAAPAATGTVPGDPVYLYGSIASPDDLRAADGGVQVTYPRNGVYEFRTFEYFERLATVKVDLDILVNEGVAINLGISNVYGTIFSYRLTAAESAVGKRTITVPVAAFAGTYVGPHTKADEIMWFRMSMSGTGALAMVVTGGLATSTSGDTRVLFDPSVRPETVVQTTLYPDPPERYSGPRRPTAYIADVTPSLYQNKDAVIDFAKDWPAFGVDFNMYQVALNRQLVTDYSRHGIRTIFETSPMGHYKFPGYLAYVGANSRRSDGSDVDEDGWHSFFPMHGQDETHPAAFDAAKDLVIEAAAEGFSDHILVDYVWPWSARYGYSTTAIAAYRADLGETDRGVFLSKGNGLYSRTRFWDYLAIFTDETLRPSDLGLGSWAEFTPTTEVQASNGGIQEKRNLFLFNALWHYEHLKYLQGLGDVAAEHGIGIYYTPNPEDLTNGTDYIVMGMGRGVTKTGIEFFGDPMMTAVLYRSMPRMASHLLAHGNTISMTAEINGGGHGATRYVWDTAYANYYDLVSAAKPIDYNNQYVETRVWPRIDKVLLKDPYTHGRHAHWAAGALAFFHSHEENSAAPAPKSTLLVCSRGGAIEYQAASHGTVHSTYQKKMRQDGNIARLLDQLHMPFDSVSKELLEANLDTTQICVYVPATTRRSHASLLHSWLGQGKDRAVLTHSWVPFSHDRPMIDLKPGLTADLSWDGEGHWNTRLNPPPLQQDRAFGLHVSQVDKNRTFSFVVDGATYTTTKDLYRLKTRGQVVLATTDGTPLISVFQRGANRVVYIHIDPAPASDEADRIITHVSTKAAGMVAEISGPPSITAHCYDVPGGRSTVSWHVPTADAQFPKNLYQRVPLDTPIDLGAPVSPNTDYSVYHFYDNTTTTVRSDANGRLTLRQTHSVEIFYWGRVSHASFAATVDKNRETRAKLAKYEPDEHSTSLPFAEAVDGADPDDRFLSFTAGVADSAVTTSDGTTITFLTRASATERWMPIGKYDTNRVGIGTALRQGIKLGTSDPSEILVVVSRNVTTSYDTTYVQNLAVTDRNGTALHGFGAITERGLVVMTGADNDPAKFTASGAVASGQENNWTLRPAFNTSAAPVYAILGAG